MVNYGNSKELKGHKAILTEEVSFKTNMHDSSRIFFDKGTEVTLAYYQSVSDLYIFTFKNKQGQWEFPIRNNRFEWVN
jgi:hypothetical protein